MDRPVIGAWLAIIRDLIVWGHPPLKWESGQPCWHCQTGSSCRVANLLLTSACCSDNPRRAGTINNGYPCYGPSHDFSPSRYLVLFSPLAAFCSWPRYGGCTLLSWPQGSSTGPTSHARDLNFGGWDLSWLLFRMRARIRLAIVMTAFGQPSYN